MPRVVSRPFLMASVRAALICLLLAPAAHAQWITQSSSLKAGWNSVYLHVDSSHTNVNSLIGTLNIEEVWLWTSDLPPGLSLATPPNPTPDSQWIKWTKREGTNSVLKTLPGNAALLVKVASAVPSLIWNVKGRPVAPTYRWTLTGLNFVGFPVVSTGTNFEAFLAPDAQSLDWKQSAEIYRYQGGNLGATNPIAVTAPFQRNTPVVREQAYWIRTGEPTNQIYNQYFGPFQVTGGGSSGLRFGDDQGQARLTVRNMTGNDLTVTLQELDSEAPPTGSTPRRLPLMVRGAINTTDRTFGFSSLAASATSQWTLTAHGQPGSEAEIVLGVDRSQMGAVAGQAFAGVLRFTDSLGLSRVDIGATATTSSRAGLWVGNAVVDQVSQYLKPYTRATNASHFHQRLNQLGLALGENNPTGTNVLPFATSPDGTLRYEWDPPTGRVLVFGTNASTGKFNKGSYLLDGPIKADPDYVARPFPLRLIVHHDGTRARLMQRAYLGRDASSNLVVATRQTALLPGDLVNARRLSAVHLPTSDANIPWPFAGAMKEGATLETTIDLGYNDHASNPFLHTYHPDHDNLDNRDDTFQTTLPSGKESYEIRRLMRLTFSEPGPDFDSRTQGGTHLTGDYSETVSLLGASGTPLKQFNVLGMFDLTRITDTATLLTP